MYLAFIFELFHCSVLESNLPPASSVLFPSNTFFHLQKLKRRFSCYCFEVFALPVLVFRAFALILMADASGCSDCFSTMAAIFRTSFSLPPYATMSVTSGFPFVKGACLVKDNHVCLMPHLQRFRVLAKYAVLGARLAGAYHYCCRRCRNFVTHRHATIMTATNEVRANSNPYPSKSHVTKLKQQLFP